MTKIRLRQYTSCEHWIHINKKLKLSETYLYDVKTMFCWKEFLLISSERDSVRGKMNKDSYTFRCTTASSVEIKFLPTEYCHETHIERPNL